jgi:hypothetical protein
MTYREAIDSFWSQFGGTKNTGFKFDKHKKLLALKRSATVKLSWARTLTLERENFNTVKFRRHSFNSHKLCFVCGLLADVRHHIIQLQNGGINAKKNVVSLCNSCHAEIHPWLKYLSQ